MMTLALVSFLMAFTYTFHSRAKVSGSIPYHAAVGLASNLTYATMLVLALRTVGDGWAFIVVYAAATTAGGVVSHWLCLRLERGRARTVQEDRVLELERRIRKLEK
jgi:membrane protein YqaA with SNARE-associated domain